MVYVAMLAAVWWSDECLDATVPPPTADHGADEPATSQENTAAPETPDVTESTEGPHGGHDEL
jgi:hypothetical protein